MIKKTDILLDILDHFPKTMGVIKAHEKDTKTCLCCTMLFATIEEIATHHQLNLDLLLQQLNDSL